MIVDDFITYLATKDLSFSVTLSHTMDPDPELAKAAPALFVFLGEDDALPSEFDNEVIQEVRRDIYMMLVAKYSDLEEKIDELRGAYMGWQRNQHYRETMIRNGRLLKTVAGISYWLEIAGSSVHQKQVS